MPIVDAKEANRRSRSGQKACLRIEPSLRDKYEAALRANAKRVAKIFRDQGIQAAGKVPTLDEVLRDAALSASVTARTKAERQRIAEAAAHPIITEAGKRELRALLEPLVAAQAGVQAERIVAGVRDRVAAIMLDALVEGLSVPETARVLQAQLELDAVWQAEMLARTDLISLSNAGSHAAAASLEDGPKFKTWLSAGDSRVRPTHVAANRQVQPIDMPYVLSEGVELQYPGDPAGPDGETINCFPGETLVHTRCAEMGFRRWYDGPLVVVETDGFHELSGTPNHPVLTIAGWSRLSDLREGDYLVCGSLAEGVASVAPDVDDGPAAIQDVFDSLANARHPARLAGSRMDFHGDGSQGQVEVVSAGCALGNEDEATFAQPCLEDHFVGAEEVGGSFSAEGAEAQVSFGSLHTADGIVSASGESRSLGGRGVAHPHEHRFAPVAWSDSQVEETLADGCAADAIQVGKSLLGSAGEVAVTQVVKIDSRRFSGHVFNLQTATGAYLAGGIVSHNCRCVSVFTDTATATLRPSSAGGIHDEPVTQFDAPVTAGALETLGYPEFDVEVAAQLAGELDPGSLDPVEHELVASLAALIVAEPNVPVCVATVARIAMMKGEDDG